MSDPVVYKLESEGVGPGGKPIPSNLVRFEYKTEKNEGATKKAGVPVHDQVLMGYVISPGNTRSEACQRVAKMKAGTDRWEVDKTRLNQITKGLGDVTEKFLAGEKPDIRHGTPLTEWPPMDARTIADLKAMSVLTVEELADMNDNAIGQVFGGVELRNKARKHIDYANKNVTMDKLAAENRALLERLAALEAKVGEEAPRKVGRPRKVAA